MALKQEIVLKEKNAIAKSEESILFASLQPHALAGNLQASQQRQANQLNNVSKFHNQIHHPHYYLQLIINCFMNKTGSEPFPSTALNIDNVCIFF